MMAIDGDAEDLMSSRCDDIQRRQYQKQHEQQQQQRRPLVTPTRELPEKQHQAKHNPISEALQLGSPSSDQ